MPRLLTAGESHGPALVVVVDGFPAGIPVSSEDVDRELRRRQAGYGRGPRASQTLDHARIIAGVSDGMTNGAPVAMEIANPEPPAGATASPTAAVSRAATAGLPAVPRPGHADLAAALKFGTHDFWPLVERASARETAARVAGASVARALLAEFGATVGSCVTAIGPVRSRTATVAAAARRGACGWRRLLATVETDPVRCADPGASRAMVEAIDRASADGDTLGGVFEVVALGCPPGLGGFAQWDRRLDARLASAVMSVPGIRGVEVGLGFAAARRTGRAAHDAIVPGPRPGPNSACAGVKRDGNRAGGLEGGTTNGSPVVIRAAMKPIPTLGTPMMSVDLETGAGAPAPRVRGDVCAVPAAAVVAEAMVAWELAVAFLERFGGDTLAATRAALARWEEMGR